MSVTSLRRPMKYTPEAALSALGRWTRNLSNRHSQEVVKLAAMSARNRVAARSATLRRK